MAIPLRNFPDIFFICLFFLFPVNLAADTYASLLYCNYNEIRNCNLHTQQEVVVVPGLRDCYAVDYHSEKNIVFWSDYTEKKIYRSQNGEKTAFVESVESFGIAVDWLSDLVYWTNTQKKSVEVAKLDGSERRTVIKREEGAQLRTIVLHPVEGILFWTDVGSSKKIERCDVDGTNRIVIASESLRHPEGLSIDIYGRTIYWLDRELQNLNTAKFDGTQRRVIYSSGKPLHSFFLDVDHHYLYWASGETVSAIKKENGSDLVRIRTASRNYRGMKVLSHSKQPTNLTLNSFDLSAERQECVQWFLETRSNSSVNKWGRHLPRTAVALYLSNADYFAPENKTGQEIRYELTIHLLSTLNRHEILRTEKLTMYVLAMLVSCLNPRNFFNHDIVSELRKRVDISKYTNPLAILALCNAGAPMTDQDVERLNETYNSHHRIYWTEVQVISTLALSCISSKTNVSVDQEILNQWVDSAKKYLLKDKSAINPRTAALIIQLMLSTNYPTEFNWIAAFRAITNPTFVRSSNILDKYYLTPILSNKSLNAIDNKHCHYKNDLLFNSNRDAIVVRYTVRAEKDVSLGKSWSIKVPPSSTLYDVMTTVQALDATHTLQFNIVDGKPYIRSVSGLAEDPEYDNYWFTYVRTQEVSPGSRLLEESPVDVTVSNDDEFIIWYRNAIWKTSSYGSGEHP